jgi:hypothetical protein
MTYCKLALEPLAKSPYFIDDDFGLEVNRAHL